MVARYYLRMKLSFVIGLGFLLLLFLLTGSLLVRPEGKLLFIGIIIGFAGMVLALLFVTSP
jgi:hypothetical protein